MKRKKLIRAARLLAGCVLLAVFAIGAFVLAEAMVGGTPEEAQFQRRLRHG